ncbi:MAG: M48 family metalloprotease [Oscillospiraceae bacterium]|nr:M48 family metalloprotease [Oscillospiraceae bacterium]
MFQAVRSNKTKTTVIVTAIFLFFFAIIYAISFFLLDLGIITAVIALVISFIASFAAFWNSDKIVLRLHKARPATPEQDAKLNNILEGLCIAAGVPKPRLYVMEDPSPNAFATGRNPQNAVICVTTGLLDQLDYYQLEGVVAHELAHIKNYDILLQTVAGIMIGSAIIASNIAVRTMFWSGAGGRRSSNNNSGGAALVFAVIGILFMILAPLAGQLLKMSLSRNREFLADATAAEFTRNPEALASALEVIGGSNLPLRNANNATEGMYIVTPCAELRRGRQKKQGGVLFSTHPPIAARVEALRNLR